jgi:RNA polymerase sigma-70 factor (ECF subfamily)
VAPLFAAVEEVPARPAELGADARGARRPLGTLLSRGSARSDAFLSRGSARSDDSFARGSARSDSPVQELQPPKFQVVYAQHAAFVFRVLRGMGVPDGFVEDALQDVFMVVLRRLPEFDGRHALRTWLFEIALRVASDHRRKHKRRHYHEPLSDDLAHAAATPAEESERAETTRAVMSTLERLSEDKRMVLVLADLEGLSAPEIAELARLPLSNVYTRLRRARIAFSEAWGARAAAAERAAKGRAR